MFGTTRCFQHFYGNKLLGSDFCAISQFCDAFYQSFIQLLSVNSWQNGSQLIVPKSGSIGSAGDQA
jgi:hypothetical protein